MNLLIRVWLLVASIVVTYDAAYILLRPASMLGGDLYAPFSPYSLYIQYDRLYADTTAPFSWITAYLNLVEVLLQLLALYLASAGSPSRKTVGLVVAVVVSTMTLWKTVLYMWYVLNGFTTQLAFTLDRGAFLCFYLPNAFWILLPLYTIFQLGGKLARQAADSPKLKQ